MKSTRISSLFVLDQVVSDNAMISIYPLGKDLYAFAETPFIHRIDPVTLETTRRVTFDLSMKQFKYLPVIVNIQESIHDKLNVFNQSSHPHITKSEEAYQLGQKIGPKGPSYVIIHYPPDDKESKATERARIVATVPCRSLKEPSYMHSFSITDSYFVLIEQPLNVSFKTVFSSFLSGKPLVHSLKWRPNKV